MPMVPTAPPPGLTSGIMKRQAFLSQHEDLLDKLIFDLLQKPCFSKLSLILPHLLVFNLLPIILNLKNLPGLSPLFTSGKRLLMKFRSSSLKIARRLKWLTINNTQYLVTQNANHLLLWVNLILNPSKFTFTTIILHLITHLNMWINHVISVTPPAPLGVLSEFTKRPSME